MADDKPDMRQALLASLDTTRATVLAAPQVDAEAALEMAQQPLRSVLTATGVDVKTLRVTYKRAGPVDGAVGVPKKKSARKARAGDADADDDDDTDVATLIGRVVFTPVAQPVAAGDGAAHLVPGGGATCVNDFETALHERHHTDADVARLRELLAGMHRAAQWHQSAHLWHAYGIGVVLDWLKADVAHGAWLAELTGDKPAFPGLSQRTAQHYMAVARVVRGFPGAWRCGLPQHVVSSKEFHVELRRLFAAKELADAWSEFV